MKAIGFEDRKYSSMIDGIEGVLNVKKENHRLTSVLTLLCQEALELGQLTPRAAMPAESLLCII
jgi:hypothetical protein